ncbi:PAS domain-containing protein [Neoaquamicrobium sediminum]|uniref:PAS domain-containing protein n=1 Tax=Neoaquamicrobium sediminum TaxID=1849104 RepID=UPI0015650ACA|nr:PAS domain-containing protein [Mesorhizobium sediminum]NRC54018.1 hypothetical protein [Mesorhizobium sediminum]
MVVREGRGAPETTEAASSSGGPGENAGTDAVALLSLEADWFWETDAQHRITHLSEGYREATGIDPARVLGRSRLDRCLKVLGRTINMAASLTICEPSGRLRAMSI